MRIFVDLYDCSLQVYLPWSFDGLAISGDMGLLFGGNGLLFGGNGLLFGGNGLLFGGNGLLIISGCWWTDCCVLAVWLPCWSLLQDTSISSVFCTIIRPYCE